MDDEWISMLGDELDEEAGNALLERTSAELEAFLRDHPEAPDRVLGITGRRLARKEDAYTWSDLNNSLVSYLGSGPAFLLSWLSYTDQQQRLERLGQHGSVQVLDFARLILGLYGLEIQNAFRAHGEFPNDWRYISRYVYYDQIAESWLLSFRIEKQNGEEVFLETTPDSMMNLAGNLLEMISAVGSPQFFGQARIQGLLDAAQLVIDMLKPQQEAPLKEEGAQEEAGSGPETL